MFQTDVILSPNLPADERLIAIREAYNADRSQMTLMLAYKLRVPEVEVIRALEGDTAHELDFSRWEELIRAFEALGKVTVILSNGAATVEVFGQIWKIHKQRWLLKRQNRLTRHAHSRWGIGFRLRLSQAESPR